MTETAAQKLERQQKQVADGITDSYRKNAAHCRDRATNLQNECNRLKGDLIRRDARIVELEAEISTLADVETTARFNARLLETERAQNKLLLAGLRKRLQRALSRNTRTAPEDALPLEPKTRGRRKLFKD